MIKVFNGTDNTFSSNGDVVLNPTRAIVHKEDNGSFYLDLETNLNEETKIVPSEDGSTITINGSAEIQNVDTTKEVELTQVLGNTTQNGTPTPTTPIPISNVSGLQEIEITNGTTTNTHEINLGKNLLNNTRNTTTQDGLTFTINDDKSVSVSGTFSSAVYFNLHNGKYSIEPNTTYTLSGAVSPSARLRIRLFDNTLTQTREQYLQSTSGYTFTTASNEVYYDVFIVMYGLTTPVVFYPQLEKGNATSYSPYFTPIELNHIPNTNYKDYIFKGKGVNLFDKSTITSGYRLDGSGNPIVSADNEFTSDFIEVESGETYIRNYGSISAYTRTCFYDESKSFVAKNDDSQSFTTPSNVKYIRFSEYLSRLDTMQLEKGNQATLYEPYNAKDKWLLHKEIGKVVLDGTDDNITSFNTSSTNTTRMVITLDEDIKERAGYCNRLKYKVNWSSDEEAFYYDGITGNNPKTIIFRINKSVVGTTLQQAETYFTSNNLIFYYVKNIPTTTEITNSELLEDLDSIELLDGLNNIMVTGSDLPATLDIHYNYVSGGEVKTSYIDYLVANNILVANTPQGNQAFRITNVDKTRSKIRLQANHIFYDSQNYIIKDSYVVEKNCNEALDHLNNATDSESPFTTLSDVNTIESYRCVRKSLYEAIQVILERWGGHLVRDNFEIKIMDTIGSDNQVVVRYGKNLKNIEAVYDWNAVATKLMPVGADGLLLPEEWLYANNSYEIPYTKVISFDQSNINQEDYADDEAYQQALIDDLRQKGNEYLATNSIPMVNYTLDANLEKISDVGDTIEVIDERLGINLLTHLISFDYNCLLDRYEQLQFGNFTPKLNDLMSTISESTTQAIEENNAVIKATLTDELTQATDRIWQALGSSYIIYDGDKILVLDQLPKESAQNVIMINSGGIGFSNTGIDGTFTSAWTIDNILNMENINVINLTADLIRGGILKLGSNLNQYGQLEIYNEANDLIAEMNKDGFKMYGQDGSYILINNQVGLSGYDRNGTRIYWADGDAFHMKKSEVEEEITLCGKMRYIPIQISSGGSITNDGIGLVSVYGGE